MKKLFGRLAGFSVLPVASALLPLLALPIVARVGGPGAFTALIAGQAIGAFAATVAYVGWNVLGTPRVAQASANERLDLYARSFYARLFAVILLSPLVVLLSVLIAPTGFEALAVLFAFGSFLTALTLSWFAVGVSSPGIIAIYDLLPKTVATIVATVLVLATQHAEWYGWALALSPVIGCLHFNYRRFSRLLPPFPGLRRLWGDLVESRSGWGVEITGNLYANAPVPVVSAVAQLPAAASYASSDKIYRYGLISVVAVGNALQGWVLESAGESRVRRNRLAIVVMAMQGVAGGLFLLLFGVHLGAVLFGEAVGADQMAMNWLAVAFCAVCMSTPLIRNILVPNGQTSTVLRIVIAGAIVGIVGMIVGVLAWGPAGAAAGLAASEVQTLICCGVVVSRRGYLKNKASTAA